MISITRALSELKLLNKKIEQKQAALQVATGVTGIEDGHDEAYKATAKASIDQVQGIIDRRQKLKRAIVMSNANTTVTIGSDEMTVAEAIERKTSIEYEKVFCKKLRETYYSQKAAVEAHNEKVSQNADKHAQSALSADTEGDKGAAYTTIVAAYEGKHKARLVAPEGIENTVDDLQDKIDGFESEVDFILSESNTKTMIDV
jgi:hypothetical protein